VPVAIEGVLPVLATPFTADGDIDLPVLRDEITWVFDQGADGVVMGMVSESLRLSSEERDAVADAICRFTEGRGTVTTSVGAESLHTAIRHARSAQASGATAVMAIPPVATVSEDEEILRYYAGIIDAIEIPVVVQDASGYLGRPLPLEIQAKLFREFGDRALFKPEAPPIGPRLSALLRSTGGGASVYEGTGGLALVDSYRRGIAGTMPGPDVVWAIVAIWRALKAGDATRVRALHGPLCAFVSTLTSLDVFVAVEKHLLRRQGVIPDTYSRGPVGFVPDPETLAMVDDLFDMLRAAVDGEAVGA
jgi:dihydrodipicolinate synthase/N-acetylneuraminate lyase